jgi:hypothetical protein
MKKSIIVVFFEIPYAEYQKYWKKQDPEIQKGRNE